MPAAAAPYATVIPRKFLTVPGFDHRTFDSIKKMMARFGLYLGNRWMGLTFWNRKIEIKNVPAFSLLLSSMNFGRRTFRKSSSKKWHFNTESYGLVVKVTPMLPYNFGPPPPPSPNTFWAIRDVTKTIQVMTSWDVHEWFSYQTRYIQQICIAVVSGLCLHLQCLNEHWAVLGTWNKCALIQKYLGYPTEVECSTGLRYQTQNDRTCRYHIFTKQQCCSSVSAEGLRKLQNYSITPVVAVHTTPIGSHSLLMDLSHINTLPIVTSSKSK